MQEHLGETNVGWPCGPLQTANCQAALALTAKLGDAVGRVSAAFQRSRSSKNGWASTLKQKRIKRALDPQSRGRR
jgi:hypothetical protein